MTSILARHGGAETAVDAQSSIGAMLAAMRDRGETSQVATDGTLTVASSWFVWEPEASGHDPPGVARHDGYIAVADATLYYRRDLVAGIDRPELGASASAASLILAAYLAGGEAGLDRIEGDYAYIIWDRSRQRLVAGRDFGGKRPLYYAETSGGISIASTIGGVIADPRVSRVLDLASIAAVASGLWCHSTETCYRDVREVGAGLRLVWEPGQRATTQRVWNPPQRINEPGRSDDSAEVLRGLLADATRERLAPAGTTAVTLSGGWDSSAVFGAGQLALRNDPARALRPVSISYPDGDPGREDDLIADTAAFWRVAPQWLDIAEIPMIGDSMASARTRDEPWAHPFENWNRALSRGARRVDARVVLDGFGGDQLFQVSDVFLADLLWAGHVLELVRQWRTRTTRGPRQFFRTAIRPRLSPRVLGMLARLRGMGAPRHYLDRQAPRWVRPDFLTRYDVIERELRARPALAHGSAVLAETHAYLLFPSFPRMSGRLAGFALAEGTELRSPLLDARVVAFAAGRPWSDRVDQRETKVRLRQSMRGLLPERVLAPRPHRTGVTTAYFVRGMRASAPALVADVCKESCLADLGVIDVATLRRAWDYFLGSSDSEIGTRIYFTLQAEFWLRAHGGVGGAGHPASAANPLAAAS